MKLDSVKAEDLKRRLPRGYFEDFVGPGPGPMVCETKILHDGIIGASCELEKGVQAFVAMD